MKKCFSILSLLLLFAAQLTAASLQVSTTLPTVGGAKPEHVYTLMNGNNVYSNALTAPTATAENYGYLAFYAVDGVENAYYIYSYKAAKWLGYTKAASYGNCKNFVTLSADRIEGAYFCVENYTGDLYQMRPYTTSSVADKYINWNGGVSQNPYDGANTLGLWQDSGSADAGSRWTLTEVDLNPRTYVLNLPDGVTASIEGATYRNGDTYVSDSRLEKSKISVPAREGQFAAIVVDDVNLTVTVQYVAIPTLPAVAPYTRAVLYPQQQDEVGTATLTEADGVYTLGNNVLSAAFIRSGNALFFGGAPAMDLEPGTEPFSVAFGTGDNVPASAMTLSSLEIEDIEANPAAVGGAEHFAGKALVARYRYAYKESNIDIVWKAVLRDGSHYLRTEMELTGVDSVDMYNVIPMMYNVDTKAAGSAPQVVGNTRGAVLMSNKIFAGLENPVGYNTVGNANEDEDMWELTGTPDAKTLTASSWVQVDEADVPGRVTEATGAGYPNVFAYQMEGLTLTQNQKVEVTVAFISGSGAHRLNFGGADLLNASGNVAANDYHSGFSGNAHNNNTFSFIAPYDGTFTLRVFVENKTEAIDASSTLTAQIYTPKEGTVVNTDIVSIQGRWSRNTTLIKDETWKISAVVGLIAQDGRQAETNIHKTQKRRSFLAYSERERAVPWRPNPAYISWYELNINRNNAADPTNNMTEEQVLDVLNHWKTDFYNRYGIGPNSFVIDDGWDNYGTWTFHAKFPNEMRSIAALASEMGAGVGAWLGPVGGYGTSGNYRRAYWNAENRGGMVLSNPAYYKVFKDAAYNLTQNQGDFRFFKFDGISAQFSAVGPDAGDQGNENAEGIIRLERYVREELKRDIFFNTTVGTWASPFWYHYTDATWRQENDYGTEGNNSSDRERWITYRDRLVYQNYVTNSPICPINTLMTHGFILSNYGNVSSDKSYEACLRELRCAFLCGSGMVELYNDYPLMNSIANGQLWADLAECIAWQKRNADVLPDAHWVGGSPWNGSASEVYGWAAWNGTKSSLALRNGANNAQTYTFTLREALNIPANVNGSIVLRKAFGVQDALTGLTEGEAIDIDNELTVSLPGSSVFGFEGLDTAATAIPVNHIDLTTETADATVEVGKTLVVKATVNEEAAFPSLTWSSSDESVATVRGGLVIALKEGTAVITATAIDGSAYSQSLTVTVVPKTLEPYALNFDKNANPVRTDRYITRITFTPKGGETQVITVGEAKPYIDKSADENAILTCRAGDIVTAVIEKAGTWMNGYVFIDLDNNQQFSFAEGTTDQTGTEVMSFSFYNGIFDSNDAGVNSAGTALSGNARNTMVCPSFIIPETQPSGDYRIRFKMDWNSVDPGGQIAADGTCTGKNGILYNRGSIVDATLHIDKSDAIQGVRADSEEETLYDLSGRRLHKAPAKGVYISNGKKRIK